MAVSSWQELYVTGRKGEETGIQTNTYHKGAAYVNITQGLDEIHFILTNEEIFKLASNLVVAALYGTYKREEGIVTFELPSQRDKVAQEIYDRKYFDLHGTQQQIVDELIALRAK